jgi:hypothetical protein
MADGFHLDCQADVPGDFFTVDLFEGNRVPLWELEGKMTGAVEYNADDDQKDNCQSDQNKCN